MRRFKRGAAWRSWMIKPKGRLGERPLFWQEKTPPRGRGSAVDEEGLPAAATAAAAAAIGALLGLGHVHLDGAAVELRPVQRRNGLVGRLVVVKGDETESARATRIAIADHDGFADLAVGAERAAQALVVRVPAQTSNKQFLRHISLLSSWALPFWGAPVSQTVVNTASTKTEAGPAGRQQTLHDNRYLLLFQ